MVSGIAHKTVWLDVELHFDLVNHCLSDFHLDDSLGRCLFQVYDHALLSVYQVVCGVSEERLAFWQCDPLRRGSVSNGSLGSASTYLRTVRVFGAGSLQLTSPLPDTQLSRLGSALIALASKAKPSPLTRPVSRQRRSTFLTSQRNSELSRKRP